MEVCGPLCMQGKDAHSGSVSYTGDKNESPCIHRGDRVDPYIGRASRQTYREEDRGLPYTRKDFESSPTQGGERVVTYTERQQDLVPDWIIWIRHLYMGKRSYPYTGRHLRTLSMTSFLVSRHLYREKGGSSHTQEALQTPVFLYERSEYLTLS